MTGSLKEKQEIFPILVFLYLRIHLGHGRGDRNILNICVSVFTYLFRTWKRRQKYSQYLHFCIHVFIQDMEEEPELFPIFVFLYLRIYSGYGREARGLGGTPGRG